MTIAQRGGKKGSTVKKVDRVLFYNSNGFEFRWTRGSRAIYVYDNQHEAPFYAFDAPPERSVVEFHRAIVNHCRKLALDKDRQDHAKIRPYTWARVLRSIAKGVYGAKHSSTH